MASAATPIWTIGSLLTSTTDFFIKKQVDEPRLSAELLLAHVLQCSRMALYTRYEEVPSDTQRAAYRELVKQRAEQVPVAYLVGRAWFFSLEFAVTRDVLIPRPDTETLVEFVIQHARSRPDWPQAGAPAGGGGTAGAGGPAILDLCTGSGAIAITLAKQLPAAVVTATDISAKALAVARQNVEMHKVGDRVTLLEGDLFEPLERMAAPTLFHIIAANPPYIPTAGIQDLPATVRDHEPRLALDGGADGLEFHRRIIEGARGVGGGSGHLHPGGFMILEMQFDQGPALQAAFAAAGSFSNMRTIRDAAGHPRCMVATYAP
jgi:release factor glutamine methyltransferase